MANYIDDLEASVAEILVAYAALSTELAAAQTDLAAIRAAVFYDLMPLASGVATKDFTEDVRELGTSSLAAVQASLDAGVGDYTP